MKMMTPEQERLCDELMEISARAETRAKRAVELKIEADLLDKAARADAARLQDIRAELTANGWLDAPVVDVPTVPARAPGA